MDIKDKFALAILRLRKNEVKLTQQEIADEADLSLRFYQSLEAGKRNPSITTLEKNASVYKMKFSEFCRIIEETD